MFWWIVILLVVCAAVIYAYHEHHRDSRRLAVLFASLAEKYGGEVKSGSWLYFPRLRFHLDGRLCVLTAMATDGTEGGSPFTSITVDLADDTGEKIRIRPASALSKNIDLSVLVGRHLSTGDRDFDQAFRIEGGTQVVGSGLLNADVRRQLLKSRALQVEARLADGKVKVTMDGIAQSPDDIDALVDTARLPADRYPL